MGKVKDTLAPQSETVSKKTENKFPYSQLRDNSYSLFGVHKEVFDGAMYGCDTEGLYTKKECASKIASFKNKKI